MFDAHLHLRDARILPYHRQFVKDALEAGVTACIDCAARPEEWPMEVVCSLEVTSAFGLHPWLVSVAPPDWQEKLRCVLSADPQALVGEVGLDGIRRVVDGGAQQRFALAAQLDLAAALERPVVLHGARAWAGLLRFIEPWLKRIPAWMLHGVSFSTELLNLPVFRSSNIWLSVGGSLLAPGAKVLPRLVPHIPPERLLVETDSPDRFPIGGAGAGAALCTLQSAGQSALCGARSGSPAGRL